MPKSLQRGHSCLPSKDALKQTVLAAFVYLLKVSKRSQAAISF